jgi:hypothetical protein
MNFVWSLSEIHALSMKFECKLFLSNSSEYYSSMPTSERRSPSSSSSDTMSIQSLSSESSSYGFFGDFGDLGDFPPLLAGGFVEGAGVRE